jgi:alkylated DNA repair dioxygenase AlkB
LNLFENVVTVPFDIPKREGYSMAYLEDVAGFRILVPNGELIYVEHFFNKKVSDRCVEYFQENGKVNWKQDTIKMYGNTIPLPRLTSWYGDPGNSYSYSGITSQPNAWNEGLLVIKSKIEDFAGNSFNGVLLNWYRNGEDSLSWHADNEKVLGTNPVIASANFGETRDFLLRKNADKTQKLCIPLKHGTLLVMKGALQHHWQHSVPKRMKVSGSRFNLTFRQLHRPPLHPPQYLSSQ